MNDDRITTLARNATNLVSPRRGRPALAAAIIALIMFAGLSGGAGAAVPLPHGFFNQTNVPPDVPAEVLIGDTFTFLVRFKNLPTGDVGYSPFIDLAMNSVGADGATPCDGIAFVSSKMIQLSSGAVPLAAIAQPAVVAANCVAPTPTHPFGPAADPLALPPGWLPGWQLATLPFPLGSFFASQPEIVVEVTAKVHPFADIGVPLKLCARGGFRYTTGTGGPSIVEVPWDCQTVTPTIIIATKEYLGPEKETATGPNFIQKYKITVDVADGQMLGKNMQVIDCLPFGMVYQGGLVLTKPSGWPQFVAASVPAIGTNGCVTLTTGPFAVTGVAGPDATAEFKFSMEDVHAPADCAPVPTVNPLKITGLWTPLDPRDTGGLFTATYPLANKIGAKCLAIQKSVNVLQEHAGGGIGPTPGDLLNYTLAFQVSDYKSIGNLVVKDLLSDGQTYVAGSARLSVVDRSGSISSIALTPTATQDASIGCQTPPLPTVNGGTILGFSVSAALIDAGHNTGIMIGGWAGTPTSTIAAQGALTFSARIDDAYRFPKPRSLFVDKHDPLSNCVTIAGDLFNNVNPPVLPSTITNPKISAIDDSGVAFRIVNGAFLKSVYAIRRDAAEVCGPSTNACVASPDVRPGDAVTFRLTYDSVPSSDAEDLQITDWLPLPVFDVSDFNATLFPLMPPQFGWTPALPNVVVPPCGSAPPPPGVACTLLSDQFSAFTNLNMPGNFPHLIVYPATNSLTFDYGPIVNDTQNRSRKIDLVFTIKANARPFNDRVALTNEAQECESNTFNETFCQVALAPVRMREPRLKITKGVIATNNPMAKFTHPDTSTLLVAAAPSGPNVKWLASMTAPLRFTGIINSAGLASWADSDLSQVDANDMVTFAVIVENQGGYPAFNLQVEDFIPWDKNTGLPTCFAIDPQSIRITDGSGNAINPVGGFSGQNFTVNLNTPLPGLTPATAANGANILVITFNVVMNRDLKPGCCDNTAKINRYTASADPASPDFVAAGIGVNFSDTAAVCAGPGGIAKCIVQTSEPSTTTPNATIGEIVRFRLLSVIPEGVSSAYQITDYLPAGMSYLAGTATVALVSSTVPVVSSIGLLLEASVLSDDLPVCMKVNPPSAKITPTPVAPLPLGIAPGTGSGGHWQFDLGTLTNNNNNAGFEYAIVEYSAQVLNVAGNQGAVAPGTSLPNQFQVCAGAAPNRACDTTTPVNVDIVEPKLTIKKEVAQLPGTALYTYTVTIQNTGTSAAFDVSVIDNMPACLQPTNAVTWVSLTPNSVGTVMVSATSTSIGLTFDTIPVNETVIIKYFARAICDRCDALKNTVTVTWTSLPGKNGTQDATPGLPGTPYGERDGSTAPGTLNTYSASASTTVCATVCALKFNDANGNGQQDSGESVLPGWVFTLGGIKPTTTNAVGRACWSVLAPGTYTIAEVPQPGWTQTTVNPPVTVNQPGTTVTTKFGNKQSPLAFDLSLEKTRDNSGGVSNLVFTVKNVGGAACPGPITITDPLPASAVVTLPATFGTWACIDSDPGPNTTLQCISNVALNPGATSVLTVPFKATTLPVPNCATVREGGAVPDVNPGNNSSCSEAYLCVVKFEDRKDGNGQYNGTYEDGETLLADWKFVVTSPDNQQTTLGPTRAGNGMACMAVPRPGNYTIAEIYQSGWVQMAPVTVNFALPTTTVHFPNRRQPKIHDWAIEFYNTILDHYFLTIDPNEVDAIINGAAGPGWKYTGAAIPAYATAANAAPGTRSVCRFYGNQAKGGPNGHFYTVDADECAQVKKDPGWTFERNEFFVGVPKAGQCAARMSPVYRVYNGRFAQNDSNHRYTTDRGIYDLMISSGWRGEGVVFCAAETQAP